MLRARASVGAAAWVAAVLLAVTGCKIDTPAAASAGSATDPAAQGPGPGLTRVGALIIEPTAGFSPVYGLIDGARRSIDVTMYEFADTTAEHDLAAAAKRGVQVQVILDEWQKSLNSNTFSYLSSHRVKVVWSSSRFTYTHQKTVVVDGSKAVIMTANLTSKYYPTSRDFLVFDTNRADLAAITAVFDADYGTGHARMFVGSENFSRTSLDDNRELGLIISDPAVLSAMARTFAADFRNGKHWS
jgi:phosphatidylserine/phosphatidylglycerophosphate/cardiolipin synthase-like enzyme